MPGPPCRLDGVPEGKVARHAALRLSLLTVGARISYECLKDQVDAEWINWIEINKKNIGVGVILQTMNGSASVSLQAVRHAETPCRHADVTNGVGG